MADIPLAHPDVGDRELAAVGAVLKSARLSIGVVVEEFEMRMAEFCGLQQAVAVSSGTAGLQMSLNAFGIGIGDEVITVAFTFVATANVVLHVGATPVFADIDPITLNIDPTRIEALITSKTKAILVVHVFGRPAPMEAVLLIAKHHGLVVIEDACEALGATYKDKPVGTFGDVGVFGFYPNKIITTGEGGVVVSRNADIAACCRRLRNQGRDPVTGAYDPVLPGYNFRMSELHAALGVVQTKRLRGFLELRQGLAEAYEKRLRSHSKLALPATFIPETSMSWFVYVVLLDETFSETERDCVCDTLVASGIECGRYFPAIHLLDLYAERFDYAPGDLPVTESVSCRTIALPFFNTITPQQQDRVCDVLGQAIDGVRH